MNLKNLLLLVLGTLATSASARTKKKVWSSETHTANALELTQCVTEMEAMLTARPKSQRFMGYQCGDRWYQWGTQYQDMPKTNLFVFKKCKDDIIDAAVRSKDWFNCYVYGEWGGRAIAWSPLGHRATSKGDHSPGKWPPEDEE